MKVRQLILSMTWFCMATTASAASAAGPATPAVLKPYLGKVTYVDFWASWCGPCAQSFPWLNELRARYGDRLQVVGVNVDEDPAAEAVFLQKHPASFLIIEDHKGQLAALYAIQGMPSAVILNAQGQVIHQHAGFKSAQTGDYESAINEALGVSLSRKDQK